MNYREAYTSQPIAVLSPAVTTISKPLFAASYTFGKTITLQTALRSNASPAVPFTGIATISDQDGNPLGTADVAAGGLVKFLLTNLPPGTYTATVTYPGDANHSAATSSAFTLRINPATATTKLQVSSHSSLYGETLTLTANVATVGSVLPHTGTIIFEDGSMPIGTVTLAADSAVLMIPAPAIGAHVYTAVYSGDSHFKAGKSLGQRTIVKKDGTQATLTTSAAGPVTPGEQFTLTVVVASLIIGSTVPTGTVTFKDGMKVLNTVALDDTGKRDAADVAAERA